MVAEYLFTRSLAWQLAFYLAVAKLLVNLVVQGFLVALEWLAGLHSFLMLTPGYVNGVATDLFTKRSLKKRKYDTQEALHERQDAYKVIRERNRLMSEEVHGSIGELRNELMQAVASPVPASRQSSTASRMLEDAADRAANVAPWMPSFLDEYVSATDAAALAATPLPRPARTPPPPPPSAHGQ